MTAKPVGVKSSSPATDCLNSHGAPSTLDTFIPLDRTFHELALEEGGDDDVDLTRLMGRDALRWPNLLSEHRVILLSEAGAGKTEEIRHSARLLRKEGKPAFKDKG